jgi:hypothetical protein
VVLRFFEGRSLKEVGLALALTENAARMRVDEITVPESSGRQSDEPLDLGTLELVPRQDSARRSEQENPRRGAMG